MVAKLKVKIKLLFLLGLGLILSYETFACSQKFCCTPKKCTTAECNAWNSGSGNISYKKITLSSFDLLNLKNDISSSKNLRVSDSPISILYDDFETLSAPGKSWLTYMDADASFMMNIGSANTTTPQNWSLPSDLLNYYEGAYQDDFVSPTSLPNNLQIIGANKVVKGYYVDENNHPVDVYSHYLLNANTMKRIGTTYDYDFETDDIFDEPDFDFAKVPLSLNDSFRSVIEITNPESNQKLSKTIENVTVDAFGSITTPLGTSQCLRLKFIDSTFSRTSESQPYAFSNTFTAIGFATKNGEYFHGISTGTSGTVTFSKPVYKLVVNTSSLTQSGVVMLNNNNRGVSINQDDEDPHPSAILDIKNDSLGVLIPRIAQANRPSSPAEGLLVYQIDNSPGFYYFDGTAWQRLSSATAPQAPVGGVSRINSPVGGKGALKDGTTLIKFDSPRDDFEDLFINIQLEGDCNGVFISKKTREGFEVKELQKGKSNVKFSWSIN